MSKIRYLWNNLVDIATLYPSQEVANLPAANIQHPHRKLVWRTTNAGLNYMKFNFGSAGKVNAVAIINHNFDNDQTVYLRLVGSKWLHIAGTIASECKGFWDWMLSSNWGKDLSGADSDLTLANSPGVYWNDEKFGAMLNLNGSNQYAYRADDPDLDVGTGDFTLIGWIKTASTDPMGMMAKKQGSPEQGYEWIVRDANGVQRLILFTNDIGVQIDSNTAVWDGAWHHVAVVVDRQMNQARFYLDGQGDSNWQDISGIGGGSLDNSNPFYVGARAEGGNCFNGDLGVMSLYKSKLSDSVIADIASGPSPIITLTDENSDVDPDIIINCFSQVSRKYWRLEFANPGNPYSYIEMGRAFLGDYFEPSRQFARNWEEMLIDPSRVELSEGGQEWIDLKEKYRIVKVEFPEGAPLSEPDRQNYQEMLEAVGCSKDIFVLLDYDNQPNKWSFYGKFAQTEFNFREFLAGLYTTGFDFKESR